MKGSKNRLSFEAQLSRHNHDVSAGYSFTTAPGIILPIYFDVLNPSDTVYLKNHMFCRLKDTITAFRGEIDVHIDSFFVPLQMLFTPFGNIFAQTDDYLSSFYASMGDKSTFPAFTFTGLASQLDARNVGNIHHEECNAKGLFRLLDAFNLNPYFVQRLPAAQGDAPIVNNANFEPNISPWILASYQCIYQNYYRNDEFERRDVASYNFDSYYNSSTFYNEGFLRLHSCQRPADYFTSVRVSPVASAINKQGVNDPQDASMYGGTLSNALLSVNSWLDSADTAHGYSRYDESLDLGEVPLSLETTSSMVKQDPAENGTSVISAGNIRALFAVDKFMRIYGRAEKTYDAQIFAHMGVKVPHDVKHDITHIASYRQVMQSDPVYATSNVQNSEDDLITSLGQVGGQCQIEFDTNEDKFTAPVHGVFMVCCYFVTHPRYTDTFSKLHLLGNRIDFPMPEFDKLGAQPLYSFEYNRWSLGKISSDYHLSNQVFVTGWQNRYQQFKKKFNRISPTFQYYNVSHDTTNYYAPWFISREVFDSGYSQDFDNPSMDVLVPAQSLFETVHSLDCVLVTPVSSNWSTSYRSNPHLILQTDPFVVDYMAFVKKVSWMSETGEPDL